MSEGSFVACAAMVRRADPDRYFSALFAPVEKRPLLFALYALNHELARVAESVRDPMLGQIRLQWWREALAGARESKPRRHDVVEALAVVFSSCNLPLDLFDPMIDARAFDVSSEEFADYAALELYLDHTSGTLMRLAARILGGGDKFDATATRAGIAYGLAGLARSVAFHASRDKSFVPVSALTAARITRDGLFLAFNRDALRTVIDEMASRAVDCYRGVQVRSGKGAPFAAFLPASVVPLYARRLRSSSFDPMRPEVGLQWRLAAMLSAAVRGRI